MRIEASRSNSHKSSQLCASMPGSAASFSRNDIPSNSPKTATPDRMVQGDVNHVTSVLALNASENPTCFRRAYQNTINRHASGDMPNCIPFSHGRFMFVDIGNDIVRLGFDPAAYKTNPSMTLGPGGAVTHSKNINEEEARLMAVALYMASRNSLTYL